MIEVPRDLAANVWKLGLGILLAAGSLAVAFDHPPKWIAVALLAVFALPLIAANTRLLLVRPPALRATPAGVAFSGSAIIAWQEIKAVYEILSPATGHGTSIQVRTLGFAFHRKRTLLRLPPSLWLISLVMGVRISADASREASAVLAIKLDGLRVAACGTEDGVVPGASEIPSARVVRRRDRHSA